jgi:nicotinamide N-methyltransferase
VVSDYPDPDLIENLTLNIGNCPLLKTDEGETRVVAEGYCWGNDPQPLLSHLDSNSSTFDVLILADLLFNHSEHGKLISTIQCTLARREDAKALVFFTPYRPWLYEKDMSFFDLARDAGFVVEKVLEQKMEKVMFEKDSGNEELRKSVFGYSVRWA